MNFIATRPPAGKSAGQFFTPEHVAKSLVEWVVRSADDQLLDPSSGDGAILAHHERTCGIERDPYWAWYAREKHPGSHIHNEDFFEWATHTNDRFDCVAGNPPFIRYQSFKGLSKAAALAICEANGFKMSGLSSTWTAFIATAALLLRPGGRMAFVVPAEIGHASYAVPFIDFLSNAFLKVQVIAVRDKLFPKLSEDCWLLYCDGRGGSTKHIHFSRLDAFSACSTPPSDTELVGWAELKSTWRGRLRPLLISPEARTAYCSTAKGPQAFRFGDFARIGIGYITGDNDFFHLTMSQAAEHLIPSEYLVPTVRRGQFLESDVIDERTLERWKSSDEACLLLNLPQSGNLPEAIVRYLETERGREARTRYKCRIRPQWYSVPGVNRPDYFLQYMSGAEVKLARNDARASCTNSVHSVHIRDDVKAELAFQSWRSDFTKLSCELEGHPLGGGMLKLEPREAAGIAFSNAVDLRSNAIICEALTTIRRWRHLT